MKTSLRMKRLHAATLAALTAFQWTHQAVADDATKGIRIDNARVDSHNVPPPGEVLPETPYPLPSGVTREEAQAMRAANASLPRRAPDAREALSEHEVGALFASGKAELTDTARKNLDTLATRLAGKPGLRIAVVGHTDDQRLSPNARRLFKDNQGLSEARALAVADYLMRTLGLPASQVAMRGEGEAAPVADNGSPDGMAQNRRVEITLWFEPAVPTSPCAAVAGDANLPFRITVDGEPAAGQPVNEADRQRCTDVALSKADIQVKYDDLAAKPSLNAWVTPDVALKGEMVEFRGYANYVAWLRKAEVRIFQKGQSPTKHRWRYCPWNGRNPLPGRYRRTVATPTFICCGSMMPPAASMKPPSSL